ncbi:MAG TPA: hypothetical protein VFK11_01070 [Candidatus Saccharimonadales bacterium]|nr:hypothetical protein [Candidatus Saccharimonadales bacterium]
MEPLYYLIPGLFQLGYVAGIIFALTDMAQKRIDGKAWWGIAIVLFPFAWAIYLLMSRNIPRKDEQTAPVQASPQNFPNQEAQNPDNSETIVNNPVPAVNPPVQSSVGGAFRTVGMVLGIIAITAGAIIIGLFILLMAAFSSYGSNK